MGRQAYMNRLALGRSPYDAPGNDSSAPNRSTAASHAQTSGTYAEGYVQHYDERGHPVNPDSKTFGKELRKAKNDILSTMGIVVSGEDGVAGIPSEQQKVDMIAAENDYGLVMATLDQVCVFLGSGWTFSLAGRIQAFKTYTHIPLMSIISSERGSMGMMGFYFAGIPAWTVSTCLSICRHHPLERLMSYLQSCVMKYCPNNFCSSIVRSTFSVLHTSTRGALLVLAIQTYMYSVLQSLRLVYPLCMPSSSFFVPFGELAPMQFVTFPTDLSISSIAGFGLGLFKTPSLLAYLYIYLRPIMEVRIYRLIRRHLPKPYLADELSIRVALENDLIDWMAPTLGRRSEEENLRGNLTLWEDVKCELAMIWNWTLSWTGLKQGQKINRAVNASPREERIESLRQIVEDLQNELGVERPRTGQGRQPLGTRPQITDGQGHVGYSEGVQASSVVPNVSQQTSAESIFDRERILHNEDNRVSQSPDAMSTDYLSEMDPMANAHNVAIDSNRVGESSTPEAQHDQEGPDNRRVSRSNTLFSRPSSPETSPPTSPRVRASLIHQNSDIITMQLELLGNRGNGQGQANLRPGNGNEVASLDETSTDRRSITEFLDSLLANENQNLEAIMNTDAIDSDGLSNLTAGVSPAAGYDQLALALPPPDQDQIASVHGSNVDTVIDAPAAPGVANILPDNVEEPGDEDIPDGLPDTDIGLENQPILEPPPTALNNPEPEQDEQHQDQQPIDNGRPPAHRVTILSLHPVDSLASHLASMITTVVFLPLESLYLRSLASAYLSSRGSSALLSDVRPLGAWAGGGSVIDTVAYAGKMSLMLGMQGAVNATVWGILSGGAIRIGKRFCGWGSL